MRDWGWRYFLFPYCTNTNKILLSLMFLLLLHPLDSWKVAMIFVSNIIHRVTFLFSLLFSFYWTCQKFSSSCWRIIALSRCQIKLAKCLNTGADSISRSRGWLRRAGRLTAAGLSVECSDLRGVRCEVWVRARANPLISAGDDQPPLPRRPFNTCWEMVWPTPPHPVIHAAQNGQSAQSKSSCHCHWWCFK